MRTRPSFRPRCATSALALATVLAVGATPAVAQSLQGTGTIVTNTGGSAGIATGTNTTTVTLNPGQTVIDWIPFDNAVGNFGGIGFQYDGSTATFQSSGNFAVLNRINVADANRIISMDGDINGLVGGQTGGSIYFYSPSGFVLGANATINVGSLVLSASPITVDGSGNFITGPNNSVTFGQAVNPSAVVNTVGAFGLAPGAVVNASDYVAFVAPRVEHQGTINVAGQAALVAAEAATIDFTPDGLFNIQVTSGTTDSEGVRIGGDINGPASDGSTNHRIYAVAVPKNQLLTMTIANGANLGFDIAGAANVEGNAIVLSAGYNVVNGQADNSDPFINGNLASILLNGSNATSALTGTANRRAELSVTGTVTSNFASNVTMIGAQSADVGAYTAGAVLNIGGDVTVRADLDLSGQANANATAGSAILIAQNGGDVNVSGNATVTANAVGGNNLTPGGIAGSGTGGSANVLAQNGTVPGSDLFVGGSVTVEANGRGGASFGPGTGGVGRGGFAGIQAAGAGTSLTIDGSDASVSADGIGGSVNCTLCGGFGGGGFGGDAFLATSPGAVGSPATLSVDGASFVSASGTGGSGDAAGGNAIGGGVAGSSGDGAVVTFGANSSINLIGGLTIQANGSGGSSSGTGGEGTGGRARTGAQDAATGGTLTIGGLLQSSVRGFGGSGGSGNGGTGRGGQSDNGGNSGTINYTNVNILAEGFGGSSGSGTGGAAFGGVGWIDAFGSTIAVSGDYLGTAEARGGDGTVGGAATGGSIFLVSRSNVDVNGAVELYAIARGGTGFASNGGNATGGLADIRVQDGGTLDVIGDVSTLAGATGGSVVENSGVGGTATGGNSLIRALSGGILTLGANADVFANAFGGGSDFIGQSGSATGGNSTLSASGGGSLSVAGDARVGASGFGGFNGECFSCGGTPGDGTGGLAQIFSNNAGSQLTVSGTAYVTANGEGGRSGIGLGGNGTGGRAFLTANNGSTTTILGSVFLDALGRGASTFNGGSGGNGLGGLAQIGTFNNAASTVRVDGVANLDVSGFGGGTGENSGIQGGNGTGGRAEILGLLGTVDLNDSVNLIADGRGGSLFDGTGGTGRGGATSVFAQSGSVAIGSSVDHNATLSATGTGGTAFDGTGGAGFGGTNAVNVNGAGSIGISANLSTDGTARGGGGTTGGSGTAFWTPTPNELQASAGTLVINGNGTITIGGTATMVADAFGGAGTVGETGGAGGSAIGGEVDVDPYTGTLTIGGLTISATATGGQGGAGASGGNATSGLFDVLIGVADFALNGIINVGNVSITANAIGGNGGAGLSGTVGGNGGNGGNAAMNIDSVNQFSANSAGGTINAGTVTISAQAFGGAGGAGGAGDSGAGGNGGAGGSAQGGRVQTGSLSNNLAPSAGGSYTVGSLSLNTSVHGGDGGAGGNGTTSGGNGGAGGAAGTVIQSSSFFGVRGLTATMGDVNLFANATGGDGGAAGTGIGGNGTGGAGGNAVGGLLGVESRERFAFPNQRGTLIADDILAESIAVGGSGAAGAANGISTASGGHSFVLYNGDATIDSVQFVIRADNAAAAGDRIVIVDGTATINGAFSFETPNALSLYANRTNTTLDQASLTATNLSLDAGTFVSYPGNSTTGTEADPAARPGTFFADTFAITTGADFTTTATLDSVNLLEIIAPGSIAVGDVNGDAEIYLTAQSGGITANDIDATLEIRLNGATGITVNDLSAGSFVVANSGGQLTVNNVTAASGIDLGAQGSLSYGTLSSGTYVSLLATGLIQGGAITAGTGIFGYSDGSIDLGILDAGDGIELLSLGDLSVTSAVAGEYIDLATYLDADGVITVGGFVHTGDLTAGDSIEVRAGTDAELGNLSAGLVNPSTDPLAEYTIGVLAEDYIVAGNVATSTHAGFGSPGTITVGNVDAGGIFMVLGGGNIVTGAINAGTNTYIGSYSMMPLGGVLTEDFDPAPILAQTPVATAGSIAIGGAVDTGDFQAAAGTTFTAAAITAGNRLTIRSGGNLTAGDLTAGTQLNLGSNGNVLVGDLSGGTIDARSVGTGNYGDVTATDGLYVGAIAALSFGTMTAGETARFGSDTSVSGGNVTAGDSVIGTSGGAITLGDLSAGNVDPSSASGALYEAVVFGFGALSVGNIQAVGEVQLAGRDGISAGAIDTPSRMFAVSNGNIALGNLSVDSTVLIGGFAMFAYTGDLRADFDASPTFDSAPVAAGGNFAAGDITTTDLAIAADGNILLGDLAVDGAIALDSGGNLVAGDVQSLFSSIVLQASGNITTGDLTAGTSILVDAGGTVSTGSATAGAAIAALGIGTMDVGTGDPIEIFGTDIVTGNLATDGYIGLYASGSLATGTIDATHNVIALAGGNASFGAISTNEGFLLAGYGNFAALNPPSGFDPSLIFTFSDYAATGGNATYGGAVSVASFDSYAGGNTNVGALTSGSSAIIGSGGTIVLTGAVTAPDYVGLGSSDIDIALGATVNSSTIGFISISPAGTFIGDNTGATGGYRLSQAELDRTEASTYEFEVSTDRGALGVMTVGDLALDMAASPFFDVVEFWVGNNDTGVSGGTIRVIGNAAFRVSADQLVSFEAGTIAVNADTGSIALEDGQSNLSGYLGLYAPNIFVASGDILSRLEQSPRYAGYVDDLNAPAAVQRPNGVIRAASMEIDSFYAPLANILVQNTGTSALPAGFTITDADIGDGESIPDPNSINLVINGQIVTEGGTLSGVDVRDLLVDEFGTEPFLAGSTINGCLLAGSCGGGENVPPTAVVTPTQIDLLTNDPLGESDFGNEPDIDDNVDGDASEQGSPIAPPQPLFDSRPLVDASLVDDPISGAGNPSLYGSDDDDEDDDEEATADDTPAKGENK